MASKGKKKAEVKGASGGSLVGGIIMLALIGGGVYAADTYVDESWFSGSGRVSALIAAHPVTLYSTPQLRGFRNRCRKAASNSGDRRRCAVHYRKLSTEQSRVMHSLRSLRRGVNAEMRTEARRCSRARDRSGGAAHARWRRDATRWWFNFNEWYRRGGDHPGVYAPPPPARCVKRRAPIKDTSSWGRRRRRR